MMGSLYIISAPSGAGKTSLVNTLIETVDNLQVSISHTTRAHRVGEQQGIDYFFVTQSVFDTMLAADDFLESAEVFGHCYGTSKKWVMQQLQQGKDVILEIDWQGAQQIRQQGFDVVSIFIVPPSYHILEQRLLRRKDDPATIQRRMQAAKNEVSHLPEFDYVVINDSFQVALRDLTAIIRSYRLRLDKQRKSQSIVDLLYE